MQNLTEQVKKSEPDVAKYYAFQTKNDKGQDQVVFVEKYVFSSLSPLPPSEYSSDCGSLTTGRNRYANAAALENHRVQAHYQLFQSQAREIVAGPPDIKVGQFLSGFEARSNL